MNHSMKIYLICFAVAVVSSLLCSCIKGTQRQAIPQTPVAKSTAKLPSNWPIADITIPAGAMEGELPLNLCDEDYHSAFGPSDIVIYDTGQAEIIGKCWAVAFTCTVKWDDLVHHVENCISQANLTIISKEESSGKHYGLTKTRVKYELSDGYTLEIGDEKRTVIRPHHSYYYSLDKIYTNQPSHE